MSPVVALLTDLSVLGDLIPSKGEVDVIFDHPLEALLDPSLSTQEDLVEIGGELWPYEEALYVSDSFIYIFSLDLALPIRTTQIVNGHG